THFTFLVMPHTQKSRQVRLVRRFGGYSSLQLEKAPKIAEELRAASELAERSEALREALKSQSYNIHAA
ncbi:MAG: hypothetical protein WCS42_14050, partial [Verrucomicrobiota bacterium]